SRSRTGCPPSATPTRSWSSTTDRSPSAAHMRSCSSGTVSTLLSWRATSARSRSEARTGGGRRPRSGVAPPAEPRVQRAQREQQAADAEYEEHPQRGDVTCQPAEVHAEEPRDEGERQEHRRNHRELL